MNFKDIAPNINVKPLSPLRYPGGKSIMTTFLARFLLENNIPTPTYIEPYAGGAGAALNLLENGCVQKVIINDANIAIFSFWDYLLNHTVEFLKKFDSSTPTLQEWRKQKKIFDYHKKDTVPSLELAFATFFLNRVSRSGVLGAGPIGGKTHKQQISAKYKIDARYNKRELKIRLLKVAAMKDQIEIRNLDALALLKEISERTEAEKESFLVYLDPPHYEHGKKLYMDFYKPEDHTNLSSYLNKTAAYRWVLSYDNVPEIRSLYSSFEQFVFPLRYSVNIQREGSELLIHSKNSVLNNKELFAKKGKVVFLQKYQREI